jgi:hypothetical protein
LAPYFQAITTGRTTIWQVFMITASTHEHRHTQPVDELHPHLPSNTYWAVGRVSTDLGLSGAITMSVSNSGVFTDVGTFSLNGGLGWSTFQNVFLKDATGNNALLTLNGKQTVRLTAGGNLLPISSCW